MKTTLMAAAGNSGEKLYAEDVFSAYTYTGNASARTIANGIDFATRGGLVWSKDRGDTVTHALFDTVRGGTHALSTTSTAAQGTDSAPYIVGFTSNGYTMQGYSNEVSHNYISWSFARAINFFDIVTYVGNGTVRTIAHNLGSVPGMIVIKSLASNAVGWPVWHRSISTGSGNWLKFNTDNATLANSDLFTLTDPTASVFSLGNNTSVNNNGETYVAYLFAHDTSADGLIQCGAVTQTGAPNTGVTLGWEPQFVMVKCVSTTGQDWRIWDSARGMPTGGTLAGGAGNDKSLKVNATTAESSLDEINVRSDGFNFNLLGSAQTFVYMAIRRPNKPPTVGTQVYGNALVTEGAGGSSQTVSIPIQPDLIHFNYRSGAYGGYFFDRCRGISTDTDISPRLILYETSAEGVGGEIKKLNSTSLSHTNNGLGTVLYNFFKRAPGFFDIVCYEGDGASVRDIPHGLGVMPELWILKRRYGTNGSYGSEYDEWNVGVSSEITLDLQLCSNLAKQNSNNMWGNTLPTASTLKISNSSITNANHYVLYLFATCAGVSKVGTYVGNGSSQTINCSFTTGARFILIKRTDSTGDWYIWDTVRGIISGNDPHLSLNVTSAEVTTDDSIDPASTGFIVNQLAATNINVASATYIFLAIA